MYFCRHSCELSRFDLNIYLINSISEAIASFANSIGLSGDDEL